jgi:phospholipase/carboxylesterase
MREGVLGADISAEKPAGIERAAQAVRDFLTRHGNQAAEPVILGGYSQGAMVAAQVAFNSDEPLRGDPTLPFEIAERLQSEMAAAGLRVTWFPFDGGHDIPAEVVVALNAFLAHL